MPDRQRIQLPFPIRGVVEGTAYHQLPPGFTPRALNVWPFDRSEERMRGGQRAGTRRLIPDPVKAAGTPIRKIGQVTLASDQFVTQNWLPPLLVDAKFDNPSGTDFNGLQETSGVWTVGNDVGGPGTEVTVQNGAAEFVITPLSQFGVIELVFTLNTPLDTSRPHRLVVDVEEFLDNYAGLGATVLGSSISLEAALMDNDVSIDNASEAFSNKVVSIRTYNSGVLTADSTQTEYIKTEGFGDTTLGGDTSLPGSPTNFTSAIEISGKDPKPGVSQSRTSTFPALSSEEVWPQATVEAPAFSIRVVISQSSSIPAAEYRVRLPRVRLYGFSVGSEL